MRIQKKWLALGVFVGAAAYGSYNFKEDRDFVQALIAHSAKGDVLKTLEIMDGKRFLANPLVNLFYQWRKGQYRARFVDEDERFDPISEDAKLNEIAALYRQYWNDKMLKKQDDPERSFLVKMSQLVDPTSSVATEEELDSEAIFGKMMNLIEADGLYAAPFYLNGSYGLKVWAKQTVEKRHIDLPHESIDVEVVLLEDYLMHGLSHYATMGMYSDGGWVAVDNRVYCNTGEYDFDSEKFRISFLMHEGLHYADIKNHPELSSADLEYRSKVVEVMYCTDEWIYGALEQFVRNASDQDRSFAHAFANKRLIQALSRKLFDRSYVEDFEEWKSIPYERLNAAAKELFEDSQERLLKDPGVVEII